ncbi:glycosyltransferase involved in cell wall biosynthesis [Alkalispirillum mobile]|uniref:Glycosyltransferase involved in cell wall biosynthesis n=1 Tax=Alkalispirillum mobile TaxID=85925 RepID=A0A498CAQ7_9GAMM|nr:hypothetical protein [Alkalispirillum mobile]RLK51646.1 glycosyltransferase involved in cell wall biosynthesis [Alkalispirillum mobile]
MESEHGQARGARRRRNRVLLFPKPDVKFEGWKRALESYSPHHQALAMWRPWLGFLHILRHRWRGRQVDALVVRYLNDRGSGWATTLVLVGEMVTLATARLLGVPVFWVIHNIDRETCNQRPLLVRLRRLSVRRTASVFFVTEEVLRPHAASIHRIKGPIHTLPLGEPVAESLRPERVGPRLNKFHKGAEAWLAAQADRLGRRPCCVLVVGTPEDKYSHFWRLSELLDIAYRSGVPLVALVVSPLEGRNGRALAQALARHEREGRVHMSRGYLPVDWHWAANRCDALLRGYQDLSMSHAIFHAVQVRMPVLCMPGGVVSEVVRREGIGQVLEEDFSNLAACVERLSPLQDDVRQAFTSRRSARQAAVNLLSALA